MTLFPDPIAHRGLHDRANGVIENSASAFEAAIAGGFAIECDVQLTADGVPVIFHDDDMQRLIGKDGLVADVASADILATPLLDSAAGDRPQKFADFLTQIAGRALLQIELKAQRDAHGTQLLARSVAELLKSYNGPVTIESFDPKLLTAIRQFGFTGPRGIITYDYNRTDWQPELSEEQRYTLRNLLHWHETQFDFISCHQEALELPAIIFWRALGKPVTAWTIRTQAEAEKAKPHIDQIVFEGFDPA
ncbi:MAG: glycerophosphodiester phosphodiesterase family protein [Candidatus Devosia phytovorans]|uniref:Glycerophosphodiester phosphodiesterase family protein n=1 Tax=Candidatus Devosia phytovorans TaxID=3121372 RepID=A0AAJ6B0Y7_9HYPH|nr:glycerophosphodiester phosphodiesterase family protein [Devosia sp.]WEK06185.1 MAG: glycerophosphodiester phosphodiesterase family protein [Devosia sp.]